jgi:hypothetical protein
MSHGRNSLPLKRRTADEDLLELRANAGKSPHKLGILIKAGKQPESFEAYCCTAVDETRVEMSQCEMSWRRFVTFGQLMEHYFSGHSVNETFHKIKSGKMGSPDAIMGYMKKYFDEVIKIPGICIFQGFIELFNLDVRWLCN